MNSLTSDIELVNKIKTGDTDAFDQVYEKYSKKLYSFGLKYLRITTEAEELVQVVFLKVWENRKGLSRELSFKSYLFTIAYHEICKFFRRQKYKTQFIEEALLENLQSTNHTEESIDFLSVLNRIEKIIDTLPERQKTVFRKSRIEGMTTKEIAEDLSLAPGTVDNYISETLKVLRRKFHKNDLMLFLFFILFFQ